MDGQVHAGAEPVTDWIRNRRSRSVMETGADQRSVQLHSFSTRRCGVQSVKDRPSRTRWTLQSQDTSLNELVPHPHWPVKHVCMDSGSVRC